MKRIYSIDFTRGLVMIIMALDHVRDLMHIHSVAQSPTDLATTSPVLFFTRWITYLCAPIFVFLAGTAAYLSFKSKNDVSRSRKFLLKRGLWLMLLEFTIVNLGVFFDLGFHTVLFEVIAAIGFGFIVLSLVLTSSPKTLAIAGLLIIFCHNLLLLIPFEQGSIVKTILSPLFGPTAIPLTASHIFVMAYPPVPWLGIMLVGFASGRIFESASIDRKKLFFRIGSSALLLFVLLRFINVYGDPVPWSHQRSPVYTFLSFMNITKYPPSLLFCLVTLGVMFVVLAFADGVKNRITDMVGIYGKVPLFYFIVHFYLIHLLLIILLFAQGFHWGDLSFATGTFGRPSGKESGVSLAAVYLTWIAIVVILYRPCRWYSKYKASHENWWLSYI